MSTYNTSATLAINFSPNRRHVGPTVQQAILGMEKGLLWCGLDKCEPFSLNFFILTCQTIGSK